MHCKHFSSGNWSTSWNEFSASSLNNTGNIFLQLAMQQCFVASCSNLLLVLLHLNCCYYMTIFASRPQREIQRFDWCRKRDRTRFLIYSPIFIPHKKHSRFYKLPLPSQDVDKKAKIVTTNPRTNPYCMIINCSKVT